MRREIFTEDHDLFRDQVRRFAEREIEPKVAEWNERGMVDRAIWRRLGEEGLLGANQPVEYGGAGGDFLYDAIIIEEVARVRAHGLAASLHSDICLPYIVSYGNDEQKRKHVPAAIRGELILGIAMTEPGTGSDLAAVQTTAQRDGDQYVINGSKMFISNGQIGDLFIVVAKTDPRAEPPHRGISLILVEATSPGFVRGRNLRKLGLKGQDTSELFFEDCRVPASNLLGSQEGLGFKQLMQKLQQERLVVATGSIASSHRSLEDTTKYVSERQAFALTGFVFALALSELGLRLLGCGSSAILYEYQSAPFLSVNPYWGMWHFANNVVDHRRSCFAARYQTNEYGMKSPPVRPGTKRIALIGDSFIEGFGLDNDQTAAHQLEAMLGPDRQVLNFGVSGFFSTIDEVALFDNFAKFFDPDVTVLFFLNYNDLEDLLDPRKKAMIDSELRLVYPRARSFEEVASYVKQQ